MSLAMHFPWYPTFSDLEKIKEFGGLTRYLSRKIDDDCLPSHYKHIWWIFHAGSPCEGAAFLTLENSLNTAAAMALIEELRSKGRMHMVYNVRVARLPCAGVPKGYDLTNPADKSRWEFLQKKCAPHLSNDPDPEWNGHK